MRQPVAETLARRLSGFLGRWPVVVTTLTVLVVALSSALVVVDTGDDGPGPSSLILPIGLGLLAILAVGGLAVRLSGVDPEAEAIADRLVGRHDQRILLERWLRRTRWSRNVGGMAGLLWWALATQTQGQFLVLGLGGVALGSAAAQLHQVRRRPGLRTASLEQRTVDQYTTAADRRRQRLTAGGAVFVAFVGALGWPAIDEAGPAPVVWALSALAVLAVGSAVQQRVARRPRPALDSGLRYADDLARILAIGRGLGDPAAYWSLALLAVGVHRLSPIIGGLAQVLSGVLGFYAVICWWQNRRLGLHHLLTQQTSVDGRADGHEAEVGSNADAR